MSFPDSIHCITVDNSKNIEEFVENINQTPFGDRLQIWTFPKVKRNGKVEENDGGDTCTGIVDIGLDLVRSKHKCCNEVCREIGKSHRRIIKSAFDRGDETTMIFEDDSRFELPFDDKKTTRVFNWAKNNMSEWDIIYLGHLPLTPFGKKISNDLVVPKFPVLVHAYILNRNGMKKVLTIPDEALIDLKIAQMPEIKKVAVYPSIANQCVDPHIYQALGIDKLIKFKDMNSGLEFLQYHSFKMLVVLLLIIIIFVYFYLRRKDRKN